MLPILIALKRPFSTKVYRHSYDILKVNAKASPSEIRDSYLKLSKLYHPDTAATGSQYKFIRLRQAYERIKYAPLAPDDTQKDRHYDKLSHEEFIRPNQQSKEYIIPYVSNPTYHIYDGGRNRKRMLMKWSDYLFGIFRREKKLPLKDKF